MLLRAYLAADYRWQHEGNWHDLRIGLPVPGAEMVYVGVQNFGLLSAWNPYSVERSEELNRDADQALHQALVTRGTRCVPAFSSAADRSWREPSWLAMDLPLADLDAMGRRFGQLGVLAWRRGEPVRLRLLLARPAGISLGLGEETHVDWVE